MYSCELAGTNPRHHGLARVSRHPAAMHLDRLERDVEIGRYLLVQPARMTWLNDFTLPAGLQRSRMMLRRNIPALFDLAQQEVK
jgi:hypothetical protein